MTIAPYMPKPLPERLTQRGGDPALLGGELLDVIGTAIANQPRTLQKRIGPSEVGHPCPRRLAYKVMGAPEFNPHQGVAWKPFIGTCVHTGIEQVFIRDNRRWSAEVGPGYERWACETRVDVGDINGAVIDGSCDLYDRITASVVDWKVVGPAMLKHYKADGPGPQYRSQAHLYGRGWRRAGHPVDTVMIVFLPRNEELHHTYVWHEPYDEQVAVTALQRLEAITAAAGALGAGVLEQLPTADAYCYRCPYYKAHSTDLRHGCPGHPGSQSTPTPALTMSASHRR
jgi:hypothetical protein